MNTYGGFYKAFDWIYRIAFLNVLWLLFSVVGLIIFGFFPATVAMFSIVRRSILKENVPIFHTFWTVYKREFIKSNLLGLILSIIAYIFYVDLIFLKSTSGLIQLLYAPMLVMSFIYILMLLYVFPVYVQYDIKVLQVIKNSFLIMVLYPFFTIIMIIVGLITTYFMFQIPSSLIFFSGSLMAFIIMGCANLAFRKNEQKLEQNVEK